MDTCEDNLLYTSLHQPRYFINNLVRLPAAQPRAYVRDDAIGAMEQAAILHFHEGALMAIEAANPARHVEDAERTEFLAQPRFVNDHANDAGQACDAFRVPGRVAAHDDDG